MRRPAPEQRTANAEQYAIYEITPSDVSAEAHAAFLLGDYVK